MYRGIDRSVPDSGARRVFAEEVWDTMLEPLAAKEDFRRRFDVDDLRREAWRSLVEEPLVASGQRRPHALALGGLGVGLELLTASARAGDVARERAPAGAALLATALAILIVSRLAQGRERYAGSAFVSDAYELQD